MKKLISYLKNEKYTLIFEIIVVVIGMVLALTADSIREDYKENQRILEAFAKDKSNIHDAYAEIYAEVESDIAVIEDILEETQGVHDTINAFMNAEMSQADFKTCARCVLYVITPVEIDVKYQAFRKISNLPLYTLKSSYLYNLEPNDQNVDLIITLSDANVNIDYYYYIMEKFLDDNMKDLSRDLDQNIAFLKENYDGYYYLNSLQGVSDLDVYNSSYLNMLRAKMDLMEVYSSNMQYLLTESREATLPTITAAIEALESQI